MISSASFNRIKIAQDNTAIMTLVTAFAEELNPYGHI